MNIEAKLAELKPETRRKAHELISAIALKNDNPALVELKSLLSLPALSSENVRDFFFRKVKETL